MTGEERDTIRSVAREVRTLAGKVEEAVDRIEKVEDRVEAVEDQAEGVAILPTAVAELKGMVTVLQTAVTQGFDGVRGPLDDAAKSGSTKNAIQFAAIVLVPIIVALIGAFVAVKTGAR